jgi:hypothetical protein
MAPSPSEVIRAAQDELEQAIQLGGLARDPMRHPLRALSATIGAIHDLHRAGIDHHERVRAALAIETRSAVERATAEMRAAEATTIERISMAIAASAEEALARRVRVVDRNTALLAGAALFLVIIAAAGAGYAWGRSATWAAYRQTETGLNAAFRDGPEAAHLWLSLVEANDPRQVIRGCTGGDAWSAPDGRRACRTAIWLDPPKPSTPSLPLPRPIVSR